MISNLMMISKSDVVTLENDGKGYCLIAAFFQGLHDERRLQEIESNKRYQLQ